MAFGRHRGVDASELDGVALFEGMEPAELEQVAALCTRVEVSPGDVLVDQGDAGVFCYVVAEGTAAVYVAGEYVATSGPGTTIGEMALIDHRPRTATVVANDPMVLLRFDPAQFRRLLEAMPRANERIMDILGRRLEG